MRTNMRNDVVPPRPLHPLILALPVFEASPKPDNLEPPTRAMSWRSEPLKPSLKRKRTFDSDPACLKVELRTRAHPFTPSTETSFR